MNVWRVSYFMKDADVFLCADIEALHKIMKIRRPQFIGDIRIIERLNANGDVISQ